MASVSGHAVTESEAVEVEYGSERIKLHFAHWAFKDMLETELAADISAAFTEARFDREDAIRNLLDGRRNGEAPHIPGPHSPEGIRRIKYLEAAQDIEIQRRSSRGFFHFTLWGDGELDLSLLPKLFTRGSATVDAFKYELEDLINDARGELQRELRSARERIYTSGY